MSKKDTLFFFKKSGLINEVATFKFVIQKKDLHTNARLGYLETPHGAIETPGFVPVATKGGLRGLEFERAIQYGAQVFMANTFHFFHNDRYRTVATFGGLHNFLHVQSPLMTDSGGFQVFSLGFGQEQGVGKIASIFPEEGRGSDGLVHIKGKNLVRIEDGGVTFRSPYDGKTLMLTPERSMKIQQMLGADIIFSFDECTSPLSGYEYTKQSLARTHRWAVRCLKAFHGHNQALFGIVQGGAYQDLRRASARYVARLPVFGFGIGGSLGKSKKDMHRVLQWTLPHLPEKKPRHLLGIGEVGDIFEAVARGVDLFDCVIPTRWARHGSAMTHRGRKDIRNAKYLKKKGPIDAMCRCRVCEQYSSAYVAHLLREKEIFGIMLLAEHNVAWILALMKTIRDALENNTFLTLKHRMMNPVTAGSSREKL